MKGRVRRKEKIVVEDDKWINVEEARKDDG